MKTATFALILAVCSTVTAAQNAAPQPDVTIKLEAGTASYCIGSTTSSISGQARGPDDIMLTLPLKVRYVNHRTEKVFLAGAYDFQMSAIIPGKNDPFLGRRGGGGVRDVNSPLFWMIELEKAEPNMLDLMQCLSVKDPGCSQDFIYIPVRDRSAGLDLRGKTVEIITTRDHTLPQDMVQKLKEKMKERGIVFSGVIKSEPLSFRISDDPPARNCGGGR